MRNIERLSALTPGTSSLEPGRGSTAPMLDLKGVEIAATLKGLTEVELCYAQVKFIGETSEFDRLLMYVRALCFEHSEEIKIWIGRKPESTRKEHINRFSKAVQYILNQHIGDYRCQVCNGLGYLYAFSRVCSECAGGGVSKLNLNELGRSAGIKKGWAYNNRPPINACRDIIIHIETSAIIKINQNSR